MLQASSPSVVQKQVLCAFLVGSLLGGFQSFLLSGTERLDIFVIAVFVLGRFAIFSRDFVMAHLAAVLFPLGRTVRSMGWVRKTACYALDWTRMLLLFFSQAAWMILGFMLREPHALAVTSLVVGLDVLYVTVVYMSHRIRRAPVSVVSGQFRRYVLHKFFVMLGLGLLGGIGALFLLDADRWSEKLQTPLLAMPSVYIYAFGTVVLIAILLLLIEHRAFYLAFDSLPEVKKAVGASGNDQMISALAQSALVATVVGPTAVYSEVFAGQGDKVLPAALLITLWIARLAYYQRESMLRDYGRHLLDSTTRSESTWQRVGEQVLFSLVTAAWLLLALVLAVDYLTVIVIMVLLLLDVVSLSFCRNYLSETSPSAASENAVHKRAIKVATVYFAVDVFLMLLYMPLVVWMYFHHGVVNDLLPVYLEQGTYALGAIALFVLIVVPTLYYHNRRFLAEMLRHAPPRQRQLFE